MPDQQTGPSAKRQCFWIDPAQDPAEHGGYVPSLVTEGEAGHSPMLGNGALAAPWVWGKDLATAERVCDKANADSFGLSRAETNSIMISSMLAQRGVEVAVWRDAVNPVEVKVFIGGVEVAIARIHEIEPGDRLGAHTVEGWRAKGQQAVAAEPAASAAWQAQVLRWYDDSGRILRDPDTNQAENQG